MKALVSKLRHPNLGSILGKFDKMISQLEKLVESHSSRTSGHRVKVAEHQLSIVNLGKEVDRAQAVIANLKTLTNKI